MDDLLIRLFGKGDELTTLQISIRTFAMFIIALILLRIGGLRIFGKKSAFDEVVIIMLGAILSRGVVGATPFADTVISGTIIIATHRVIAWLCAKNMHVEVVLKGRAVLLYKNGKIVRENLDASAISERDLLEGLRVQMDTDKFDNIDSAYLEPGGQLSFIEKNKN